MFEKIVKGDKPSVVFRRLMLGDPALTNRRLASLFYEEFPEIDSVAMQHIWHWRSPNKLGGHLADEELDDLLADLLTGSGYICSGI